MDILDLLKSAFLGLVEGITEWLPISSTGHMILVDEFVKMNVSDEFWNMFLVVIQLGAILSVVVLYFHDLNPFSPSKGKDGRRATWSLWGKIILGCIPAAVIGLPLNDFMDEHFYNSYVVAAALIVYGIAFIVIENWRARRRSELAFRVPTGAEAPGAPAAVRRHGAHFAQNVQIRSGMGGSVRSVDVGEPAPASDSDFGQITSIDDISWKTALGIGCFQVLSLVPGTSRSGSTIIGGLLLGTTRSVAAKFTFYLAIPVMFGASLLKVVKFLLGGAAMSPNEWGIMVVGLVVAFVVSLLSIKWLTGFVRRHDFKVFGWYRIVLGVLVLAYFLGIAPALGLA